MDFLVICRVPVDEDTDANEDVVGFFRGDRAVGNAVGDRLGDGMLRRAEHLHRLLRALDCDLGEQYGGRLDRQVRRDNRQEAT